MSDSGIEGGARLRGLRKRSCPGEPLVSVIVPCKNAAATLPQALDSVLGQTYANVEILVLDGVSDDGTVEILKRYDERIDYWRSAPDRGTYDAMNRGVEVAAGDWLYFLGADDVLVDVLHRIVPRLAHPRTVYYGDVYMASRNRVYDGPFPWHKLRYKNVCHQAIFYPRAALERYRYLEKYPDLADYDLNLKLWSDRDFKTRYLPELVAIFGVGKSASLRETAFGRDREELMEKAFGARIRRRELLFKLRRGLAACLPRRLRQRLADFLPDRRRAAVDLPWRPASAPESKLTAR